MVTLLTQQVAACIPLSGSPEMACLAVQQSILQLAARFLTAGHRPCVLADNRTKQEVWVTPAVALTSRRWDGAFVEDYVEAGGPPWGISGQGPTGGLCGKVHPPAISCHSHQVNARGLRRGNGGDQNQC